MSFLLQFDSFYCKSTKALPLISLINIIAFVDFRYESVKLRYKSTFAVRPLISMKELGILKINEEAERMPDCIRFDKGSAKFDIPDEIISAIDDLKDELSGHYFYYPKTGGEEDLKKAIVNIEKDFARNFDMDEIVVTHGGMSGLYTYFSTLNHGDEVITNNICFEGFSSLIDHFGLKHKRVEFDNLSSIRRAITARTKAIIFNSPENPTGKIYEKDFVDKILEITRENSFDLVSDEVVNRIIFENNKWYGPAVKNETKGPIIINSFSKTWFIPGVRLGWIASKDKQLISKLVNSITAQSLGPSLFSQKLIALTPGSQYQKILDKHLKILDARRKIMKACLDKAKIEYAGDVKGGMNFYVNLRADSEVAAQDLIKGGVAIIPGRLFEGKKSTYARIGFGAVSESEIKEGVEKIAKFIKGLPADQLREGKLI